MRAVWYDRRDRRTKLAEGIEGRPALREAFQPPGSLVPVDVFYERKKAGTGSNQ